MTRKARRQVDPFTAGDPIMPWDEPGGRHVPLGTNSIDWKQSGSANEHVDDHSSWTGDDQPERETQKQRIDDDQTARARPEAEAKAQRARRASPKKPARPKPATPAEATPGPVSHDAAQKSERSGSKGGCSRWFVGIFIFLIATNMIGGVVSCAAGILTRSSSEPDYDTADVSSVAETVHDPSEELQTQFEEQADEFLTNLATPSGEDLTRAQRAADAYLAHWYVPGGLSSIGVDPQQFATWALAGMTHSMDSSYAMSEEDDTAYDCSSYFDLQMRSATTVLSDLGSYAYELDGEAVNAGRELTAEQKAKVQERLAALEASAEANPTDRFMSLTGAGTCDADGSNPSVELSREARDEFIDSLFGVYSTEG